MKVRAGFMEADGGLGGNVKNPNSKIGKILCVAFRSSRLPTSLFPYFIGVSAVFAYLLLSLSAKVKLNFSFSENFTNRRFLAQFKNLYSDNYWKTFGYLKLSIFIKPSKIGLSFQTFCV